MGFYFRKSVSLGPFRVNLSKSGVGYSIGGKGFRTGHSSTGRKYTSMSLPGTGLRYVDYAKKGSSGCALFVFSFAFLAGLVFSIVS